MYAAGKQGRAALAMLKIVSSVLAALLSRLGCLGLYDTTAACSCVGTADFNVNRVANSFTFLVLVNAGEVGRI